MACNDASAPAPAKKKLACLCSPTNHPGSFRCIRHRTPSSSAAAARAKGRSVRAHLLQMISDNNHPPSPSSSGRRRRSCDFQPRPSRLRQCAS
uniref:Uncharacterized protein n=1 Tax=Leersia perrieri TaxID=77586 RepID=A0A0D9VM87_9ORYZ